MKIAMSAPGGSILDTQVPDDKLSCFPTLVPASASSKTVSVPERVY
jgi:hypothetical protein